MATTSNIKIENIGNNIELSFNVIGKNGSVYDTAMIAVEYDDVMDTFNVVNYFTKTRDKEIKDKVEAELYAMKLISKLKKLAA